MSSDRSKGHTLRKNGEFSTIKMNLLDMLELAVLVLHEEDDISQEDKLEYLAEVEGNSGIRFLPHIIYIAS